MITSKTPEQRNRFPLNMHRIQQEANFFDESVTSVIHV